MGWSKDTERGELYPPQPVVMPVMQQPPPQRWFPWVVPAIFSANVGMFAYTMYVNNCPEAAGASAADTCVLYSSLGRFSFQPRSENLLFGPAIRTLERLGALKLSESLHGEEWRLFACMWLHIGVIHLLANMLSLLFIGINLEREFGFLRIGVLYLLSGLGGSLASALRHTENQRSISVGASGAIFGLLGAMLSELIINWSINKNKCAALSSLLIITIINLALGFLPRMDGRAHFGGFVAGFLLGFVLLMRPQYGYISHKYLPSGYEIKHKPKHNCCQYFLWVTALVCVVAGFIFGFDLAFNKKVVKNANASQLL